MRGDMGFWDQMLQFRGQLISYTGGMYAVLLGLWGRLAAAAETDLDVVPDLPPLTTSELIGIGGLLVVLLRLMFDVWVYLDRRRSDD